MRVLLIEDDQMIGESVAESLKDSGYAVDWVKDGDAGLHAIASQQYDLLLLDLGLPRKDGISVLRSIRQQQYSLPVIVLTARDALEDRIAGLDAGADDYLVKPFALGELNARMRAVLRRQANNANPLLGNGIISLDPVTREACLTDATPLRLSAREFALLQALLVRPGAILSRAELEEKIYAWGDEVESNAIEFFIHSLRKKFGSDIIKNVRGLGWMVAKAN
ncbi:response regulator [Cellvibrio sp. OA-2007]|uniref:response regulator n=1 Tax=Cellvibrio sp. OA-2007 TaxID=529823 RepID=UPI000783273E|nr:response regulator [Cellvibrio sp. OA-2007]